MSNSEDSWELADYYNPKMIVLRGLKSKIAALGQVRVPFDLGISNPKKEAFPIKNGKLVPTRKIIVRRVKTEIFLKGIGREFSASLELDQDLLRKFEVVHTRVPIGWIEKWSIEISVWSVDARDRDNLMSFVEMSMLELEQEKESNGVPFFINNLVFHVEFENAKEEENNKIAEVAEIYVGRMNYSFYAPFFGNKTDSYRKYRFIINSEITEFGPPVKPRPPRFVPPNHNGAESGTLLLDKPVSMYRKFAKQGGFFILKTPVLPITEESATKIQDTYIVKDRYEK